MPQRIKVIDLFAGPGGLGEGFASVGPNEAPAFKIAVSVEKEASAHKTLTLRAFTREFKNRVLPEEYYQYVRGEITKDCLIDKFPAEWNAANLETLGRPVALGEDNRLIHSRIRDALGTHPAPWVLIGGPPCQAYSIAGRARNSGTKGYIAAEDGRHFLYKEYLNIIKKFQPAVFVMENVKGILSSSPTGQPIFEKILSDLRQPIKGKLGYKIFSLSHKPRENDLFGPHFDPKDFILKAEEYGIPQARHRVILLGIRSDISVSEQQVLLPKNKEVNVGQILSNMPRLRSGLSKVEDTSENWRVVVAEAISDACKLLDVDHNKILTKALPTSRGQLFLPSSNTVSKTLPPNLKSWIQDDRINGIIQHESRAHMETDIARYSYVSLFATCKKRSPKISEFPEYLLPNHKNVHSGNFVDRFKSQLKGSPSKTITSHISKDSHAFIHFDPTQSRGLTVREAARIQTFPENYFFEGNRTQQYVQVGNAVPPFLASLIGEIVEKIINMKQ